MATRTIRPTDLLALASFARRGYCNEAKTRRDFAAPASLPTPLPELARQWLFARTRRLTCIAVDGGQALGLASGRRRGGHSTWEVDRLLLPLENRVPRVCTDLLDHLVESAGTRGVHKIFLRLREDSDILFAAQQAGFFPYKSETLFVLHQGSRASDSANGNVAWIVRPKVVADHASLFRLYSATVPAPVREVEALTLQEWLANRDGADGARFRRELVAEKDGALAAWLQSVSVGGNQHLDILALLDAGINLQALLEMGLRQVNGGPVVYCLVPDYLGSLQSILLECGYDEVARFRSLAKQLAARARQSFLVPAGMRSL
ncbi:MAG: hypothetical protein EPO21_10620 [Chloroflexota bacterium]|nr:MAG: hypothetical protein EPO21_10620 [Chloroflexota bacterium]